MFLTLLQSGGTPVPPTPVPVEDQPSNWQAFKRFKKQKLEEWQAGDFIETPKATPEQIRAQREALGILPPETHRKAQEAVARAVEAQVYKPADNAAQNSLEAARAQAEADWIEAYREALVESYVAEAIWREEMETHRRKVARHLALLLIS